MMHHDLLTLEQGRGEDKGGWGVKPPTIEISPPPQKNAKYCPHTSCTNSVVIFISDGLQLIVIAVDTHVSQFEFFDYKNHYD